MYLWDIPRIKDPAARFENMVKISETQPSPALLKFQSFLQVPAVQLTNKAGGYRQMEGDGGQILIAPAWHWLSTLP
jgi:hypothetical protein